LGRQPLSLMIFKKPAVMGPALKVNLILLTMKRAIMSRLSAHGASYDGETTSTCMASCIYWIARTAAWTGYEHAVATVFIGRQWRGGMIALEPLTMMAHGEPVAGEWTDDICFVIFSCRREGWTICWFLLEIVWFNNKGTLYCLD
jgi:hypothetical protein